jgi:hypothetical protein
MWFLLIVFILIIFIGYVSISNCIEYKKIMKEDGTDITSSSKARFLFIVNIIASIFSCIIFCWIIFICIYSRYKRLEKNTKNI